MVLFQCVKKTGKVVKDTFVSVLGSDGGTYLIETQNNRKVCNIPKKEFSSNFMRIC
jgi:hypothetical protein